MTKTDILLIALLIAAAAVALWGAIFTDAIFLRF